MKIVDTLPLAGRALLRNKVRSFLTTLGVIIGVASVISMVAVGEGAKARVEGVFASMGTNLLIVLSGSTMSGGVMGGYGSMPTLTWDDMAAIRKEAPAVRAVAPVLSARVTVVSDDGNWTTTIAGSTSDYFDIRGMSTARGTLFANSDNESGNKVIVLGPTVADRLFGAGVDPLDRTVRLRSVPFQVIGILQHKGQSPMGQDYDDVAIVPVSTFQAKLEGSLGKYIPGILAVSARTAAETTRAADQVATILRDRHHLASGEEDDFNIRNLTEIASASQQGTTTLTSLLAAIAVVALVVGGIGIMNIMLVSVTERTKEIGLRMAVGAKPSHLLLQFLVEALALSTVGGVLGTGIGVFAARTLAVRLGWPFVTDVETMVIAFGFSVVVGVGFGLYPARKAARLDPIDALRYE